MEVSQTHWWFIKLKQRKSQPWRRFGYPVLISIDLRISFLRLLLRLRRYIKHWRQCFIGYPNTSSFITNTSLRIVISTLFLVFGYPDKTLSCVWISWWNTVSRVWYMTWNVSADEVSEVNLPVHILHTWTARESNVFWPRTRTGIRHLTQSIIVMR